MRRLVAFVLAMFLLPRLAGATPILINPGAGLASNAAAMAAFNRAAMAWGGLFSDPITVNIAADLVSIASPDTLGSTSPVLLQASYTTIRNQMVADAADEPDDAIVAALPTAAEFHALAPSNFTLSGAMVGTKANLKAMGFTGLDAAFGLNDATMQFNSNFAFDYDRSDGLTPGTYDFQTVATHEIGHALGFISFVDQIDFAVAGGTSGAIALEPLDLFRFAGAPGMVPTTLSEFTNSPRMMVPGVDAAFTDLARTWAFSTGQFTGDGRQASHWKDDELTGILIGVMDPTLSARTVESINISDIRALDLIGWDAQVPEPASLVLFATAVVACVRRTYHRRGR